MGFFTSRPSRKDNKLKKGSGSDIFKRHGGKLTRQQLARYMWQIPLRPQEKEYVKRVMERFDQPHYSRWITREEFEKGLEEMAKNPYDPIDRKEVERLKRYFLGR